MNGGNRSVQRDDSIEQEIRIRLWERSLPYVRHSLLAAAVLVVAFLAWDMRLDPDGNLDALLERGVTSAVFGASYLLIRFSRSGRRWLKPIYIGNVLAAPILLLWILLQTPGAYELAHSSFLAVTMAVMVIGPSLRISIPLAVASLAIPNLAVLFLLGLGARLPGLPDASTAINLGWIHFSVGAIAVTLIVVHTRLTRQAVIDNVHLEQLAGTDPLTAVPNRRQLESEFRREQARQRRHGSPIGVLELDIDHFKRVNDTHGHGVGDEVLRSLSRRWQSLVREIDMLARVGGEEFVVLLPETDRDGAWETAERLRAGTAVEPVNTSAGNLPVTISIGVTLAEAGGSGGLDSVIDRVDRALYEAKRNGRNRCEYIEPG